MIPKGILSTDFTISNDSEATKTYKISSNQIKGYIDNIEVLKQSIYKMLTTDKYEYQIYSFDYGIELESLIGKDLAYVKAELKRRIQDCLLQDERIQSADNFIYTIASDEIVCSFNVTSIYGTIKIEKEVTV